MRYTKYVRDIGSREREHANEKCQLSKKAFD